MPWLKIVTVIRGSLKPTGKKSNTTLADYQATLSFITGTLSEQCCFGNTKASQQHGVLRSSCCCRPLQYDATCECYLLKWIFHSEWLDVLICATSFERLWEHEFSIGRYRWWLDDLSGTWRLERAGWAALQGGLCFHHISLDGSLQRLQQRPLLCSGSTCFRLLMQTSRNVQKLKTQLFHCSQSDQFHRQFVTSFFSLSGCSFPFIFCFFSADTAQKRQIVLANTALYN